jgi:hypothetical protein
MMSVPWVRVVLATLLISSQAGCLSRPPTRTVFKTPGLGSTEWSRAERECAYEAEKATASADPKTAVSYTWRQIYIMCAELKGATFVGRVTMPDEQWQRLSSACREEADSAAARRPPSRARDEMTEDLAVECLKRNGVVFSQSLYP